MSSNDKPSDVNVGFGISALRGTVTAMPTFVVAPTVQARTYEQILNLPKPVLERIAEIAVYWAAAEYELAGMQYCVHLLDRKAGRDYSVEPRLKDVTEDVTKLGKHRQLEFPFDEWVEFTGTITECDKTRNTLLHAVWFYDENEKLCIQDIKGQWPKDTNGVVHSKKQVPGKIHITEAWLESKLATIKATLVQIRKFSGQLEVAVRAWRDK